MKWITFLSTLIIISIAVPLFISAPGSANGSPNVLKKDDFISYEFMKRDNNGCSIFGNLELRIEENNGSVLRVSYTWEGNVSFPGETSSTDVEIGYYSSVDTLGSDLVRKCISSATEIKNGTFGFYFQRTISIKADETSRKNGEPDWEVVDDGAPYTTGIAFHRNAEAGRVNFTYIHSIIAPGTIFMHIDTSENPENIRHREKGFDLELFGKGNKVYHGISTDVYSFNNDDIFHMEYSECTGLLVFYGYNDLTVDNADHTFYYKMTDTNLEMTDEDEPEKTIGSHVTKYLPGFFVIAILATLGMEIISGRFGTMVNRKKSIFILVVLVIVGSLISIQFLVLKDNEKIIPTKDSLFLEKYELEIIDLEYDVGWRDEEYNAAIKLTLRNTGEETFKTRTIEVKFFPEKYNIPIPSGGPGNDPDHEYPIYTELKPGETVDVPFNVPLGKEDPKWTEVSVRVLVLVATDLGDYEFLEREIRI